MPELENASPDAPPSSESPPAAPAPPPSPPAPAAELPSWEQIRKFAQDLALRREHYAGYPMPDDECELVLHPRAPLYDTMNGASLRDEEDDAQVTARALMQLATLVVESSQTELRELLERSQAKPVNQWYSTKLGRAVFVVRGRDGKSRAELGRRVALSRADLQLHTLGVARNWDLDAELAAMRKLQELVTEAAWHYYVLTGTFLESSKRSGITYFFRRCRPTLALSGRGSTDSMDVLCALCLHPIGYYSGSYGGAMVPTDDVIAHLLLMRGDEHHYWKCCNQHPIDRPEAGV